MAAGILVVDLHRNIHFDAAQRIDNVFEAVEVDLGIMGNGHTRQLRYGFHRESGSADGMCSVQLVLPVFPHVYQGIAVDGDERRLLVHRVDAREDDAVAAELIAGEFRRRFAVVRPVGSHEQDIERLVRQIGFHERIAQLGADAVVKVSREYVVVRERSPRPAQHQHAHNGKRDNQRAATRACARALVIGSRHAARRGSGFALNAGATTRFSLTGAAVRGAGKTLGARRAPLRAAFVVHCAIFATALYPRNRLHRFTRKSPQGSAAEAVSS